MKTATSFKDKLVKITNKLVIWRINKQLNESFWSLFTFYYQ